MVLVLVNGTVLCGFIIFYVGCVIEKKHTTLTYRGDKLRERYQYQKIFPYKKLPMKFLILLPFKIGNFFMWTTLGIVVVYIYNRVG